MLFRLPGCAARLKVSKFLRESSSFHIALPGGSGCKRTGVPAEWHETQRAWPGRLARKIGCTFVLKYSKSSETGGEAGCWRISASSSNTHDTPAVCTNPPCCYRFPLERNLVG